MSEKPQSQPANPPSPGWVWVNRPTTEFTPRRSAKPRRIAQPRYFVLCGVLAACVLAASLNTTLSVVLSQTTNKDNTAGAGMLTLRQWNGSPASAPTTSSLVCLSNASSADAVPSDTPATTPANNTATCSADLLGGYESVNSPNTSPTDIPWVTPGSTVTNVFYLQNGNTGAPYASASKLVGVVGACESLDMGASGTAASVTVPVSPTTANLCYRMDFQAQMTRTHPAVTSAVVWSNKPAMILTPTKTIVNNPGGFFSASMTPGERITVKVLLSIPSATDDYRVQGQRVRMPFRWNLSN